jgi:hypothetical protein
MHNICLAHIMYSKTHKKKISLNFFSSVTNFMTYDITLIP